MVHVSGFCFHTYEQAAPGRWFQPLQRWAAWIGEFGEFSSSRMQFLDHNLKLIGLEVVSLSSGYDVDIKIFIFHPQICKLFLKIWL